MKPISYFLPYAKVSVVVLTFLTFTNAFAQIPGFWQTFGPFIGTPHIRTLVADPSDHQIIYAGTQGSGLYKSTDSGLFWRPASAPLNDKAVSVIHKVNDRIYVGTDFSLGRLNIFKFIAPHGVFYSTDGGESWTQANSPMNDKAVTTLISVKDTLYVGTFGSGIFKSIDRGVNWTQIYSPITDEAVTAIIDSKGTLYAATAASTLSSGATDSAQGVFFSKNGGVTWTQGNSPINNKSVTSLILVDNTLYAGTNGDPNNTAQGIFYSTNGGIDWKQANTPMNDQYVTNIISAFGALYAGTLNDGIFYSLDGGVNWDQANPPLNDKHVVTLIATNNTLYAGTLSSGIYYSNDRGINWKQANYPMSDKWVTNIISVDDRLYAGLGGDINVGVGINAGVYRSTDGGRNWFSSSRNTILANATDMLVDQNYLMAYGGGQYGLFQSLDGGLTWIQANTPMNDKIVQTIISVKDTLYAGTYKDGIFFSTNLGESWVQANAPMNNVRVETLIRFNGKLYAGTDNSGVFYSKDGGLNWEQAHSPMDNKDVVNMISVNSKLYVGTYGQGVFLSTDEGVNWKQANPPMNDKIVTLLTSIDGTLYAGAQTETDAFEFSGLGIFYSTDGGINWIQSNAPMNDKFVTNITSVDGTLYAGAASGRVVFVIDLTEPQGVFYSNDGGKNWTQANSPINNKYVTALIPIAGKLYASTEDHGVFQSANHGKDWLPIISGIGKRTVNDLIYMPLLNRLYAATENGVYLQTLDTIVPTAVSLNINEGVVFTSKPEVRLLLTATGADSMILSENALFRENLWQAYRANSNFTFSSGDGLKTIFAKLKDISWNESQFISAQITLDTTPPEFDQHTPPQNVKFGNPVMIKQRVTEVNFKDMLLQFQRIGEPWSKNLTMAFQKDSVTIDGVFVTNKGIDYRIIAADVAGNIDTLQNGSIDFFSLSINLSANDLGSSPGLPAGTGGSSYRLVSIPMNLSGAPSVKSALGIRGKYGKDEDWRFWIYQGNEQWREGDNIPLQNGEGYFLILRNGGTLTNKVAGTTMETTAGVLGTIPSWRVRANDWTIIGNPYNTRIELSQLKLKGQDKLLSAPAMDGRVWAYSGVSDNGGWTKDDIALEHWSGVAIYSTQADTVVFANSKDPYAKSLSKSSSLLTENLQEDEWLVQIHAESGDYADNVNYFGVRKEASAEQDVYDWYEPPSVPGGISVNFPHAEWPHPASFTSDIRPIFKDGYKWQVRVNASSGTPAILNFKQLETVPNSFEILLLDESNRLLRDLRKQPQVEIRIPQESDTKNLVILVGKQDFVQSHTAGLRAIPQSFALHQNYPNPFNPTTVIRYELPVAGRVMLKIYNLLGTEVTTLENDKQHEAGYYEKVVDLRGFASGIYFYRISVNGEKRFEMTKKLVLAK